MPELIPAILVQNESAFRERVSLIKGAAPLAQIDVMDGAFVPNRTWFDKEVLRTLQTDLRFELHLMVKNPVSYLEDVKDNPLITRLVWHVAAAIDHAALITRCHETGKEAGLAISPTEPIEALTPFISSLDEILVMGSAPGFSGQALQTPMVERVKEIKRRWPDMPIGFDIGVNAETIPLLKAAGVERFCAAGAIFKAEDPKAEIRKLTALI